MGYAIGSHTEVAKAQVCSGLPWYCLSRRDKEEWITRTGSSSQVIPCESSPKFNWSIKTAEANCWGKDKGGGGVGPRNKRKRGKGSRIWTRLWSG